MTQEETAQELARVRMLIKEEETRKALERDKYKLLDDYPRFFTDVCGLAITDQGDGHPWFDLSHKDAVHWHMIRFMENDNGKHKLLEASRNTGKTYLMQALLLRKILKNPEIRLMVSGETIGEALTRADWIRAALERLEAMYGPLITRTWSRDRFTVTRKRGRGGQATVSASGPGKATTGRHWDEWWPDDIVGEQSADSPHERQIRIKWVKRIWAHRHKKSIVKMTGTEWPGYTVYRWVREEVEQRNVQYKQISPGIFLYEGKYFDIMRIEDTDENGVPVFPHFTPEFLEQQRYVMGEALYQSQYKNREVRDEDLAFETDLLRKGEAPGGGMNIYLLTDLASSTRDTRHGSMTALAIIGVAASEKAYVLDMKMGLHDPTFVANAFAEMWTEFNPLHAILEKSGQNQVYKPLIDAAVKERGGSDVTWREPSRQGKSKNLRILALRPHMVKGKLLFTDGVSWDLFRTEPSGEPRGFVADQFLNFAYDVDDHYDALDCLCDTFGYDEYHTPLCPAPTTTVEKPKEKSVLQQAREQALRMMRPGGRRIT